MNIQVPIELGLEGRYRLTVRDGKTLAVKRRTPWMKNIITDIGLNRIGSGLPFGSAIQVGSSNTPPVVGNTQLGTYIAGTTSVTNDASSAQSSAPYYSRRTRTWRFTAGQAAGTIAEVGVGWTAATGNLFSRALVLDANGIPTTITVLSDEVLDITYELRVYPPTTDKVFQRTINGVLHDCVFRAREVTSPDRWVGNVSNVLFNGLTNANQSSFVFNGTLGPITGSPSGVSGPSDTSGSFAAYVNLSMQRKITYAFGLNNGNVPGGVSCTTFTTNLGSYQMSFSPPIAKDNTKTMTLSAIISWGRYNP